MSPVAALQLNLRLKHACLLGRSFVAAGISAVIDDIIIGDRLDALLSELADTRFVFVMLRPRLEVVRAREATRGTSLWREWEWLDDVIERETQRLGLWLDTSDLTVAQTVDAILARGWTEGMVTDPACQ